MERKTENIPKIFIDSSVYVSAVISSTGGSFRLFQEANSQQLQLLVNGYVYAEVLEVIQRKYPERAARIYVLADLARLKITDDPAVKKIKELSNLIHPEDAPILAGAIKARADFLITLDQKDFLTAKILHSDLPLRVVTPAIFFQHYWQ